MTHYSLLVSLHVASVIVWLGSGTTVALVAIYAQRARDGVVLEQLGALVQWMALRVFAPASLAAFGFGVAAAHAGHWPDLFWFHVGEGAFVFSLLVTVALRLPLLRRARRGTLDPAQLAQYLLAVALAELTVLYLAVADMVVKPGGIGTSLDPVRRRRSGSRSPGRSGNRIPGAQDRPSQRCEQFGGADRHTRGRAEGGIAGPGAGTPVPSNRDGGGARQHRPSASRPRSDGPRVRAARSTSPRSRAPR